MAVNTQFVRISVDSKSAAEKMRKLKDHLEGSNGAIRKVQALVAQRTLARLVLATPKGWTGHTRQSWVTRQRLRGGYIVTNKSKVMLWLEKGTRAHGPVNKKFLFIPKTRKAALTGWSPEMKINVDYYLAKRVAGIKAMHIVQKERRVSLEEYRRLAEAEVRYALSL